MRLTALLVRGRVTVLNTHTTSAATHSVRGFQLLGSRYGQLGSEGSLPNHCPFVSCTKSWKESFMIMEWSAASHGSVTEIRQARRACAVKDQTANQWSSNVGGDIRQGSERCVLIVVPKQLLASLGLRQSNPCLIMTQSVGEFRAVLSRCGIGFAVESPTATGERPVPHWSARKRSGAGKNG